MSEKKLRIALIGAAGRMGQAISKVAPSENVEVMVRINAGDPVAFEDANVVIDFSNASAGDPICAAAKKSRTPLVMGTTGHSADQRKSIETAARVVPVVFASNFSVGINLLFALTEKAAEVLGSEVDLEIVEAHHRMKKDAPSGTAKTLAEIMQCKKSAKVRHGREGLVGERDRSEIGIHSIRGGDIVGDHTVIFAGEGERLELMHRAASREIFARGALRAAKWVVGKAPGLYSMRDVLGV